MGEDGGQFGIWRRDTAHHLGRYDLGNNEVGVLDGCSYMARDGSKRIAIVGHDDVLAIEVEDVVVPGVADAAFTLANSCVE